MKKLLIFAIVFLLVVPCFAADDGDIPPPAPIGPNTDVVMRSATMSTSSLTAVTVATLPTGAEGKSAVVSDGADSCDCTVGSGTTTVECVYTEGAWVSKICSGSVSDVDELPGDTVDDNLIDRGLLAGLTSVDTPNFAGMTFGVANTTTGLISLYSNTAQFPFGLFAEGSAGIGVGWRFPAAMAAGDSFVIVGTNGYLAYSLRSGWTKYVQSGEDPTVNDDITSHAEGTVWLNTADNGIFDLVDNTDGAAVWVERGSGSGLANVVEDLTPQLGGDLDTNGHAITGLASVSAGAAGANLAGSGIFRTANNVVAIASRNAANSADIDAVKVDSDNHVNAGDVDVTARAWPSQTPTIGDPDAWTMSGDGMYAGTWIANAAGTGALPAAAVGMNFIVKARGAIIPTIDPNGTEVIYLNGVSCGAGVTIVGSGTAGDSAVCQYSASGTWDCDAYGFTCGT